MKIFSNILVLIPFKNEENYIERCLSSVANQSYRDFRVLMSDNHSTDASAEIAGRFEEGDSRFMLFRQGEQKPVGENWNSLVSRLDDFESNFVMWLAADDFITDTDYLMNMISAAESRNHVHCFVPKFMNTSEDGEIDLNHEFEITYIHKIKILRRIKFASNWANCVSLYGVYRRETFEYLAKTESSRIKEAPESDWWWTFALTGKFLVEKVSSSIYVKTIKQVPYYRQPELPKSGKPKHVASIFNVAPVKVLLSIKSRELKMRDALSVCFLVTIVSIQLAFRRITLKRSVSIVE